MTAHNDPNGEYLTLTYTSGLLTKADRLGRPRAETTLTINDQLTTYTDEFDTTTYTYVTGQGAAAQNALASIT